MKGQEITLKRTIPAYGKNPNTEREIVGLEDVLKNRIEESFPLLLLSQRNDVSPSLVDTNLELPDFLSNNDKVIGEIISFDNENIYIRLTSDIDIDFTDKKISFTYNVEPDINDAKKYIVQSIICAYIMSETQEEYQKYLEEINKTKEENLQIKLSAKFKEITGGEY